MKYVRDEKGYTLALTLILVMLIFMFTATFTVASMNQSKQIVRTDQSFVATSLAEMGAERVVKQINTSIYKNNKPYNQCMNVTATTEFDCFQLTYAKIVEDIGKIESHNEVDSTSYYEYTLIDFIPLASLNATNYKSNKFIIEITGVSISGSTEIKKTLTTEVVIPEVLYDESDPTTVITTGTTLNPENIALEQWKNGLYDSSLYKVILDTTITDENELNPTLINVLANGATFDGQMKEQGVNEGLNNVKIFAPDEVKFVFDKFFDVVNNSYIEAGKINITHNSYTQSSFNNSTVYANEIVVCKDVEATDCQGHSDMTKSCNEVNKGASKCLEIANSCFVINTLNNSFLSKVQFLDSVSLPASKIYFYNQNGSTIPDSLKPNFEKLNLNTSPTNTKCQYTYTSTINDPNPGTVIDYSYN